MNFHYTRTEQREDGTHHICDACSYHAVELKTCFGIIDFGDPSARHTPGCEEPEPAENDPYLEPLSAWAERNQALLETL